MSGALKLWERVPDPAGITGTDRMKVTLRAAAAAHAAGDGPRAVALAQEAAATAEASADPVGAARSYERLGQYLLDAGRFQDGLRARARAVELVPAHPPTPLRARVTAAVAQALIHTGQQDEARRWCEEALAVARVVGSAEVEADILVTLGIVEQTADPTKARSLYAAGRARAADASNLEIALRALLNLGWLEFGLGNLAAARAAFDEGSELADRAGLGWSDWGITIRRGQCYVRFEAGDWDECERLAGAVPDLMTTLAVAELAAAALHVEVGRGRVTATRRLRDLAGLAGLDINAAVEVAGLEADQATWQGDLDRARSAVQRASPSSMTAKSIPPRTWISPGSAPSASRSRPRAPDGPR